MLRAARRFEVKDNTLEAALDQAAGTPKDPDGLTDEEANDLLEAEGLPNKRKTHKGCGTPADVTRRIVPPWATELPQLR